MANIFQSLLGHLNSVFNKDPKSLTAFKLQPPTQVKMVIKGRNMSIIALDSTVPLVEISFAHQYDAAKNITIRDVYETLQKAPGFNVSDLSLPFAPLAAIALEEGEFDLLPQQFNNVRAFTSLLWAIFKPVAYALETARNDVDKAIKQLGFVSAEGEFLDYWGSIFGVNRFKDEPDYEYSTRLLWETIKPRLNNRAIEELIRRGIGYETTVVDLSEKILLGDGYPTPVDKTDTLFGTDSTMVGDSHINNPSAGFPDDEGRYGLGERYTYGSFGVFIDAPINHAYYRYTTEQIQDVVERHRAAGTTPYFIVTQVARELLDLVSQIVTSLEADIDQELSAGRVMLFGDDDHQFYGDHWSEDSVSQMPWYQNNLQIPSLGDNVVLQSRTVEVPPDVDTETEGLFTQGALGDGFMGSFNRNLLYGDSDTSLPDEFQFRLIVTQVPIGVGTTEYVYSPVTLTYKRVSDEYITPRVVEGFADDVMTKTASTVNGAVNGWSGLGNLTDVQPSTDTVFTTPLQIVGPTSITGVKFDEIALRQANLHDLPIVVRNLEIPNFGEHWKQAYGITRRWVLPVQDACGNRYYIEIEWPVDVPPPAAALRIANPTATITADLVQIEANDTVNVTWNATNGASATLRREVLATGAFVDTVVGFSGTDQINNITQDTRFTILINGNNGQLASASVIITVVEARTLAQPPVITAQATPDVLNLCETSYTTIEYEVVYNSLQTESQTVHFAADATSIVLLPFTTDPEGTAVLSPVRKDDGTYKPRKITVSRTGDGLPIEGGWTGLDTPAATFTPLDPVLCQGKNLIFNYDVNYGGSTLKFQDTDIALPNDGNVWHIQQQVRVQVPPPPLVNLVPQTHYVTNYKIEADNYATAPVTMSLPVYIDSIKKGPGDFVVATVTPNPIKEAVGNTINEMIPVTITGTGFSSNMQVLLSKPVADTTGNQVRAMLVEAAITSIDWMNNTCTFIAPRFEFGTYPMTVIQLDCVGNQLAVDKSKTLTYYRNEWRDAPIIRDLTPKTICLTNGFVSKDVIVTGQFFRDAGEGSGNTGFQVNAYQNDAFQAGTNGAVVSLWTASGPLPMATKLISDRSLKFTMNYTTPGTYDISVTNGDTAVGTSNNKPLRLMAAGTTPVISEYGYAAPLHISGCAYYGTPFTLHWNCVDTSYVSFTSSDARVQTSLQSDDPLGWPAMGSVAIPVYVPGTTITIHATNDCNNQTQQVITVTEQECERTVAIRIIPNPVRLTDRLAYKLHTMRDTLRDSTGETFTYDITDDNALIYKQVDSANLEIISVSVNDSIFGARPVKNYADPTCISLVNKILVADHNGYTRVQAAWNGFTSTADVYVELPKPISLTATPNPISYSNVNETFPLTVIATYSDGTTKDVTDDPGVRYFDYDPNLISVSTDGVVVTRGIGSTYVQCSYVDAAVDPKTVVYDTVTVGKADGCIGFNRFYVDPAYQIAGKAANSRTLQISSVGVNNFNQTLMVDGSGNASYSYVGVFAGTDNITVTATDPAITSNVAQVLWIDPNATLAACNLSGRFNSGGSNGAFAWNGQDPLWVQDVHSLNFNDGDLGQDSRDRPVKAAIVNSAGIYAGYEILTGNGYQLGKYGPQQSIFVGQFAVKYAGNVTLNIYHDDGYIMSVGGGAVRVSGDWIGVPSDGLAAYSRIPVMAAYNIGTMRRRTTVTVYFPAPGLYPFEFDWADMGGESCLGVKMNGGIIPVMTLPTAPSIVAQSSVLGVTLSSTGPLVVGQTLTISTNLTTAPTSVSIDGTVTLNAEGVNVRTAILNGTSVFNGTLTEFWPYQLQDTLSDSQTYRMTISNLSGAISCVATANIIKLSAVSIDKFTIYDATNESSQELSSGTLTIDFAAPIGLLWSVSNAVRVTLTNSQDGVETELPGAGSRYDTPWSDRSYKLRAYAPDGSFVEQTVAVDVTDFKHFTHDWVNYGVWYADGNYWKEWDNFLYAESNPELIRSGQTSTVTLPVYDWEDYAFPFWDWYVHPFHGYPYYASGTYDDRGWSRTTSLQEFNDSGFSTDGSRPRLNAVNQIYDGNNSDADVRIVNPSTNSYYNFQLRGWYFWWYWDDWSYAEEFDTVYDRRSGWDVPYKRSWEQDWFWAYHAHVNVDPGPQIVSFTTSATRVNVGSPVTLSYEVNFASTITGNFVSNKRLPLHQTSFTVYPDKTTDFTITTTSPTGLSTTATVHVDVVPQVMYAPCAGLLIPSVDLIAVDGVKANSVSLLTISESDDTHIVEVFGSHFLSDRASTPELIGRVQVVLTHSTGAINTNVEIVEIQAVSNNYIRFKLRVHPYTLAGNYEVSVWNDVGMSTERGLWQSLNIHPVVPKFIMNKPVAAKSGAVVELWIDEYDPIRDSGLVVRVGDTEVNPIAIGSTISDTEFVTKLYQQVLGRDPDINGLNLWVGLLETGVKDRRQVMEDIFASSEYIASGRDVSVVGIGTVVKAVINSDSSIGIGLRTNNGLSATQVEFVPVVDPPVITTVDTCANITGLSVLSAASGQIVAIYGNNFTSDLNIYVGTDLVGTTYISANEVRFTVPAVTASRIVSVAVQKGSCFDSYAGFYIDYPDEIVTTPYVWVYNPDTNSYYESIDGVNPSGGNTLIGNDLTLNGYYYSPSYNYKLTGSASTSVSSSGAYTQPTYTGSTNTATVTTIAVNEIAVSNPDTVSIDYVKYDDLSASALELS